MWKTKEIPKPSSGEFRSYIQILEIPPRKDPFPVPTFERKNFSVLVLRRLARTVRPNDRGPWQSLVKFGELCLTHNTIFIDNLSDIHQSSDEGPPDSPEFRRRCLLCMGRLQNVPKISDESLFPR